MDTMCTDLATSWNPYDLLWALVKETAHKMLCYLLLDWSWRQVGWLRQDVLIYDGESTF